MHLVTETFTFPQIHLKKKKNQQKTPTIPLKCSGSSSPFERPSAQRAGDEKRRPGSDLKHASLLMLKMRRRIKTRVFLTESGNARQSDMFLPGASTGETFLRQPVPEKGAEEVCGFSGQRPSSPSPKGLSPTEGAVFPHFISAWVTGLLKPHKPHLPVLSADNKLQTPPVESWNTALSSPFIQWSLITAYCHPRRLARQGHVCPEFPGLSGSRHDNCWVESAQEGTQKKGACRAVCSYKLSNTG